jgi:hypothetical protein
MNELEWMHSVDPDAMLRFLQGQVDDRRLRLFACACCRRIWNLLDRPPSRWAVEVAERYADGLATAKERAAARTAAFPSAGEGDVRASWAAYWAASFNIAESVWNASTAASEAVARHATRFISGGLPQVTAWEAGRDQERQAQASLLRDIFGNLVNPIEPQAHWGKANGGAACKLAEVIYRERKFGEMTILADALEDAGCEDEALLSHCRAPYPHVAGCWALDLFRGLSS